MSEQNASSEPLFTFGRAERHRRKRAGVEMVTKGRASSWEQRYLSMLRVTVTKCLRQPRTQDRKKQDESWGAHSTIDGKYLPCFAWPPVTTWHIVQEKGDIGKFQPKSQRAFKEGQLLAHDESKKNPFHGSVCWDLRQTEAVVRVFLDIHARRVKARLDYPDLFSRVFLLQTT
ncbi:hypothetical protein BDY19DRAFT_902769 [Irpex rosettiformis]|uniref:Uncharacterized protein n=1 Tax=Irpex rosettiformis TaxID=378272 RepID=A0ACB8UF78_9APHY|nr:hypothetical protein BDY19DRAFT_902769 [Irpex rosettiformis]